MLPEYLRGIFYSNQNRKKDGRPEKGDRTKDITGSF